MYLFIYQLFIYLSSQLRSFSCLSVALILCRVYKIRYRQTASCLCCTGDSLGAAVSPGKMLHIVVVLVVVSRQDLCGYVCEQQFSAPSTKVGNAFAMLASNRKFN